MPATTATTLTDLVNVFEPTRTCPYPSHEGERTLPFTRQNFYVRPNGTADYWCRECVRRDNRERRANRRSAGTTSTRKFGVEIEFIGRDYQALIREMTRRGLTVSYEGYTHRVRPGAWKIVTDASVYNGYELVSPPLRGADGESQVRKAAESLTAAGMRVSRACGLHVHHDVNDLDLDTFKRLYRGWAANQRSIDQLVAASRRGGQWAAPIRAHEVQRVEETTRLEGLRSLYIDRYRALNIACYGRHGTVEVRQHQGTLNANKIIGWIRFGQAMINAAKDGEIERSTSGAHGLVDSLPLANGDKTFLKARAEQFGFAPRVAVAA